MRVVYRIVYAIVIALGLYLTIDLTNSAIVSKYIDENGEIALESDNYEYFVSSRYYHITPIIEDELTIDYYTFKILVYNTANIKIYDGKETVVEGFQVLLHLIDGPEFPIPFVGTVTTPDEEIKVSFLGVRLSSLPIYTFIAGQNLGIFYNIQDFYQEDNTISILNLEILRADQLLASYPLNLTAADFKLTPLLEAYLDENQNEVPTEAFDLVGYAPVIRINTRPAVIRNSVIYVAATAALTILLFAVQRQHMGRKTASPGLKTDIDKLKKSSLKSDK